MDQAVATFLSCGLHTRCQCEAEQPLAKDEPLTPRSGERTCGSLVGCHLVAVRLIRAATRIGLASMIEVNFRHLGLP